MRWLQNKNSSQSFCAATHLVLSIKMRNKHFFDYYKRNRFMLRNSNKIILFYQQLDYSSNSTKSLAPLIYQCICHLMCVWAVARNCSISEQSRCLTVRHRLCAVLSMLLPPLLPPCPLPTPHHQPTGPLRSIAEVTR